MILIETKKGENKRKIRRIHYKKDYAKGILPLQLMFTFFKKSRSTLLLRDLVLT